MLSEEDAKTNKSIKKSFIKTTKSDNYEPENTNYESAKIEQNTNKEFIKDKAIKEESKPIQDLDLDGVWEKVIAMLELPSTKMLLSQQAKLINLNSNSAEIAISEKWINMIQSRKNLIEDAFYKARGLPTKVSLIQQKDNVLAQRKDESIIKQGGDRNELNTNKEANKSNSKDYKNIKPSSNLETNSIDNKAKQFADFFNGEIVNLE